MHKTLVLSITLLGCHRDPGALQAPPDRGESQTKSVEPSRQLAPLIARLDYEARHRPGGAITADRVLDALDRLDLRVEPRRQFTGVTVKASYCLGGHTARGLVVAACEYPSSQAAIDGRAYMDQQFRTMAPTAQRAVHGNAVLTIADPAGVGHDAELRRALEAFAAL